ncbi:MAG: hypothetical protein IJ761_03390 [Bacteroidales bacterium]|nr:hypothetical protein [Bacteroidales bacterium]
MDLSIIIKQGIGEVKLHMPIEEVSAILGQASDVESIDNAMDEVTTVLRYDDMGLTLFFEGDNPTLECIDINNDEATLLGKHIFEMTEREIVSLMVANNYTEQDIDSEDWGERRISFPEANIDFYLDGGELASVIIGA